MFLNKFEFMLDFQNLFLSYVDPGAGSLVVQILIASFFGGVAAFRRSIAGWFRNKTKGNPKNNFCNQSQEEPRDDKSE